MGIHDTCSLLTKEGWGGQNRKPLTHRQIINIRIIPLYPPTNKLPTLTLTLLDKIKARAPLRQPRKDQCEVRLLHWLHLLPLGCLYDVLYMYHLAHVVAAVVIQISGRPDADADGPGHDVSYDEVQDDLAYFFGLGFDLIQQLWADVDFWFGDYGRHLQMLSVAKILTDLPLTPSKGGESDVNPRRNLRTGLEGFS